MKQKWLEKSKFLYGDFRPSKRNGLMKKLNPHHIPEVVDYIKKNLLKDWSDISFVIGINPEGFIEMSFLVETLESPLGLKNYLDILVT
jgi:hypothetical protein